MEIFRMLRKCGITQTSLRSEQKTFRTRRRIGVVVINHTMLRHPPILQQSSGCFLPEPEGLVELT